jgi:N6-L-threonylcarbamoyladenine synthase
MIPVFRSFFIILGFYCSVRFCPHKRFTGHFSIFMVNNSEPIILGIESSCDDTSAAVLRGDRLLSNITASQDVHRLYGGVVPEYASRAHQQNIIPVVTQALEHAKIHKNQLSALAYTRGPGLLGSLLVGASFSKAVAMALDIPLLAVDHLDAHMLAHFIREGDQDKEVPDFPYLCLTVSGGHTQIDLVEAPFRTVLLGRTIDDAAGEAFDKAAKIMGLPYPGGVMVDRLSANGDPLAFRFSEPRIAGLDFSFSGLKTSFLYFIRDRLKEDQDYIEKNKAGLCASIQHSVVHMLMEKLQAAARQSGVRDIAIAGGVSANSALRAAVMAAGREEGWRVFIPPLSFCTDNAAMVAIAGWFRYKNAGFSEQGETPYARRDHKPAG